jgi:hypothetical protein
MPYYEIHLCEDDALKAIEPGQQYGEFQDAFWSGYARSPEEAVARCEDERRRKNSSEPDEVTFQITPGPDVCRVCGGRGHTPVFLPTGLIDPGQVAPLGSASVRKCRRCIGTGNTSQKPDHLTL